MTTARTPEELLEAYLDGGGADALNEDEAARLMAWLREDPAHVRELVLAARLHNELRHAVRTRVARSKPSDSSRTRQVRSAASSARLRPWPGLRRRWLVTAIAAAAGLLVALAAWLPQRGDGAAALAEVVAVASADGLPPGIRRAGAPASETFLVTVGMRVGADDRIVSRSATVTLASRRDASRFVVAPQSALSLSAPGAGAALRVALDQGSLRASVAKQAPGATLSLVTPHAVVEVIGTEFELAVEATATRLEVTEGSVRFTRLGDGAVSEVAAGARAASYGAKPSPSPYQRWQRGPDADSAFFPIGVWAQDPQLAQRWRDAGVTCYVGLPAGETADQLDALRASGMPVVCAPDPAALARTDDRTIIGWLGARHPDDAPEAAAGAPRSKPDRISTIGAGAYAPTPAAEVVARYRELAASDASRPVLLSLGQGVAWDGWYGRGTRTGQARDYAHYLEGGDIAAFGIDPVAQREIAGELWHVATGVERLRRWGDGKPVWCFLSCARTGTAATPEQLRSQAWMALIHGANGLVWTHAPAAGAAPAAAEGESARTLLDDPATLAAITALNRRILALAPVLATPSLPAVEVASSQAAVPIATMLKGDGASRWLFAAAMRGAPTTATFTLPDLGPDMVVEVLDEDRRIVPESGRFTDAFSGYGVHCYLVRPATAPPP